MKKLILILHFAFCIFHFAWGQEAGRLEWFTEFNHGQIREIITKYNPDLYWFDGDWEQSAESWQAKEIREMILEHNPAAGHINTPKPSTAPTPDCRKIASTAPAPFQPTVR